MQLHKIRNSIGSGLRYLSGGNGLVSRFLTGINFTLLLLTFLKVNSVIIPKFIMILLMICVLIGVLIIGWLYDKVGLWRTEIAFDNKRNLVLLEILERVKKIEEREQYAKYK